MKTITINKEFLIKDDWTKVKEALEDVEYSTIISGEAGIRSFTNWCDTKPEHLLVCHLSQMDDTLINLPGYITTKSVYTMSSFSVYFLWSWKVVAQIIVRDIEQEIIIE